MLRAAALDRPWRPAIIEPLLIVNLNYSPPRLTTRLVAMSPRETILAELPGTTDQQRVLVVHIVDFSAAPPARLELRQQSFGPGVGWFTQSSVPLSPEQLSGLRALLGRVPAAAQTRPAPARSSGLRLLRADSA
jgi:hypothetical protein